MAVTRSRLALLALVPIAVAALWIVAAVGNGGEPDTVIEATGPMPRTAGEAVTGGHIDPAIYRHKIVVVNFWASWCPPCRREQPWLQDLHERYAGRGVQFLGVNHRDGLTDARTYLLEFGVTYPSVRDHDGSLAPRYGVPYLPATVLADRSGRLRYRLVGEQTEEMVRRLLEDLLAEG